MTIWGGSAGGGEVNGMMVMISVRFVGGDEGCQLPVANCSFARLPTFEYCRHLSKTKTA